MGVSKLLHGDCLDLMRDIPNKSIDMILCDLPYGTTQCKWDIIIPFEKLWPEYERIIKGNGIIILTAAEPFTSLLITSNLKMFKYDLIWHKTHPKGHLNAKNMPLRGHENICVFYKKHGAYHPIKTFGHIRKIANSIYSKGGDGNSVYGKENRNSSYDSTDRLPTSIISVSNGDQTKKIHETQKPVELFEYLIRTYSNEGDTILDNCSGSGTTAVACINSNRNYICIEKDERHFIKSKDRISKHIAQQKLFTPNQLNTCTQTSLL